MLTMLGKSFCIATLNAYALTYAKTTFSKHDARAVQCMPPHALNAGHTQKLHRRATGR